MARCQSKQKQNGSFTGDCFPGSILQMQSLNSCCQAGKKIKKSRSSLFFKTHWWWCSWKLNQVLVNYCHKLCPHMVAPCIPLGLYLHKCVKKFSVLCNINNFCFALANSRTLSFTDRLANCNSRALSIFVLQATFALWKGEKVTPFKTFCNRYPNRSLKSLGQNYWPSGSQRHFKWVH